MAQEPIDILKKIVGELVADKALLLAQLEKANEEIAVLVVRRHKRQKRQKGAKLRAA